MPATTKPHSLPHQPRSSQDAQRNQRQIAISLARHARKCAICNHADRAAIDDDFVSWRSESAITLDYQLPSRSSVYRHAAATGLLQRRRLNLRGVAERIIERVAEAPPTAAAVLRAMRIFAQITEDGQWVEPTKRSVVTHIHITQHSNTECHSEPSASQGRTCGPNITKSRDEGEVRRVDSGGVRRTPETGESAVHVAPAGTPSSAPSAERGIATGEPVAPPAPRSATDQKIDPKIDRKIDRKTARQLDYLPRWAAGLSDAEILIGTQNTDPETISNGEYST
ncbi:MAG: hypothetical protein WBD87_11205 [Candidatus Acidiferrales bacterium]